MGGLCCIWEREKERESERVKEWKSEREGERVRECTTVHDWKRKFFFFGNVVDLRVKLHSEKLCLDGDGIILFSLFVSKWGNKIWVYVVCWVQVSFLRDLLGMGSTNSLAKKNIKYHISTSVPVRDCIFYKTPRDMTFTQNMILIKANNMITSIPPTPTCCLFRYSSRHSWFPTDLEQTPKYWSDISYRVKVANF